MEVFKTVGTVLAAPLVVAGMVLIGLLQLFVRILPIALPIYLVGAIAGAW